VHDSEQAKVQILLQCVGIIETENLMKIFIKLAFAYVTVAMSAVADASCDFKILVGDNLNFSQDKIVVSKTCETVIIKLKHEGKLPKNMMGHNWVLTKSADVSAVATDGMSAGLNNQYVKPGDPRVIAFSEMIGGGEETSMSFSIDRIASDTDYTFFCSFPGHFYAMRGVFEIT
jgi:azurin